MEVKETPLPGVVVQPQTGEAKVPTAGGEVRVETKADGSQNVMFPNTPGYQRLLQAIIAKDNLEAEFAAARGAQYTPTVSTRVKSFLTTNLTPARAAVYVVIGLTGYWLGKKAAKALSDYFGWGWFDDGMQEEEMHAGGNRDFDERRPPRTRRPAQPPTQPSATA